MVKGKIKGPAKQILLIEDHQESAELFIFILQSEGFDVRWANSANAALQLFATSDSQANGLSPDLILLDLMLPDLNSERLIKEITKTLPALPPIIVTSALPVKVVAAKAEAIGAAGIVNKPFEIDEFLKRVNAVLNQ